MPDSPSSTPPSAPPPDPSKKYSQTPVFLSILTELNADQAQLLKRQTLIKNIEELLTSRYQANNRLISYIIRFGHPRALMHTNDIPSLADTLSSVSGAEQINLILHSPGGDATIVEKMVDMCRSHLSGNNRKFRVIVPNIAKSAATVLALGSDEILMGYCSELGPIDPQVPITVSGVTQWVSALSFTDARDQLMEEIAKAIKKKKPTVGLLQQLAGLNIPFTVEMQNWIQFAGDTADTLLDKYMLRTKFPQANTRKKKAYEIAESLLSKHLFPVHGQYIDGATAQRLGLEVVVLDKDDEIWKMVWQYYIRSEVHMNMPPMPQPGMIRTKLFESSVLSLYTPDMVS